MHPFARALAENAAARALFFPGETIAVAVSGGPDSCALLLALTEVGLPVVAALHFHHGMRGAPADDDAAFVEALAQRCGVAFQLGRGALSGANEAQARDARYAYLADAARGLGIAAIATGHTADDQAETVLLRLLRGTSPDGLAGIPDQRRLEAGLRVVRPMLSLRRADVLTYLADRDMTSRHDPTNDDPRYPRSRVRRLIPELADVYNPNLVGALCRLAAQAAADRAVLEAEADRLWDAAVASPLRLDRARLRAAPEALTGRVLLRALRRVMPETAEERAVAANVVRLRTLLETDGALDLPGRVRAWTDAKTLHLRRAAALAETPLPTPGAVALPDGRTLVAQRGAPGGPRGGDRVELAAGIARLAVRSARPGDRFAPLGMDGRTRSVRETLRAAGIVPEARTDWPLVVDAETGTILWVAGIAQAEPTRVPDGATEVIALTLTNS